MTRSRISPRLAHLLPATLAVALGVGILFPGTSIGYSLLGGSLGLDQRDVRLYNVFSDSSANDNTQIHSQFPGYDGAELAIWKAAVEWSSEPHGNGSGDPTQSQLGSGGANFDPSWQGNATQVGGPDSNVHSPLSGSSGGVLAYCETPISNGWRIRYYEGWNWDDGPGSSINGWDLQSVATHEYGHAVGLGHSSVGGSTMWPSIGGGTTAQRSIGPDDIAGLQAAYGVKSASKPHIAQVVVDASGLVTITGANFASTGNEVRFTQAGSGGDGTPVKALGIPSTQNGTRIELGAWPYFVPSNAGPGDVLVTNGGSAHSDLSNAFPIDITPSGGGCTGGVPDVSAVFPPLIDALTESSTEVVLFGCNFLGTNSVMVDGVALSTFPPLFQILSDTELRFSMPRVSKTGPIDVILTNATGVGQAVQVQVQAPTPALTALTGDYLFSALGIDLYYGGQPGDLVFLVGSPSLGQSFLPGLFTADIGNNFASLFFLGAYVVPAAAWDVLHQPTPTLPTGLTLHFQGLVFEAGNPVLPLVSTTVDTGVVLF